ncbi:hypothetical protein H4R35_003015 [Dimargaris xerosporica]|nr:hypothetical protein H4R35_003015 [Dimargaris xerosporica]
MKTALWPTLATILLGVMVPAQAKNATEAEKLFVPANLQCFVNKATFSQPEDERVQNCLQIPWSDYQHCVSQSQFALPMLESTEHIEQTNAFLMCVAIVRAVGNIADNQTSLYSASFIHPSATSSIEETATSDADETDAESSGPPVVERWSAHLSISLGIAIAAWPFWS